MRAGTDAALVARLTPVSKDREVRAPRNKSRLDGAKLPDLDWPADLFSRANATADNVEDLK